MQCSFTVLYECLYMKGKVLFYTLLCIACTGTYVSASNVT